MLDGRENPDRPNVLTINRDVQASQTTVTTPYTGGHREDIGVGPLSMHDNRLYAQTGALVDSSTDPGVQQWRQDQQRFFTGDPTVTRWEVSSR
ncbi:hypothetical protein GC089_02885 [Cellulomonas sp. JZ18]|uniref:hypothetical protein n=1 Tax=Cellulomonas sp. JZ18 TaxID=2654191 RepID=UPI0012D37AB5|nr:hypothetical protein [Cellulomonas sp. JZ18]QGQ18392.1 hypothetical protein GC089_02885 [Cellulomonas sp. JZ18]